MERMYIIVADDDIPLSEKDKDNIILICYLLYDTIMNYEDYKNIKILNEDVSYNNLIDRKIPNGYIHKVSHNFNEAMNYEPFMINDTSFAFTVHDGTINEKQIMDFIQDNISEISMKCDYNFKIFSKTYELDKKNKNRQRVLDKIAEELLNPKEEKKIKKRILNKDD